MRNYSDDEITRAVENLLHDLDLGAQPFIDSDQVEDYTRAMLDTAQYENAERIVDYGMRLYPTYSELKLLKAAAIIGQEMRLDEAEEILNEIEVTYANDAEFLEQRGWLCFSLDDKAKALSYFEKCLQIITEDKNTADPYILFDIGERLVEAELYEEALVYLKAYIPYDPESDECLFNIAYAQSNLDLLDESVDTYKKLLDIDPFLDSAWFNLGLVYTLQSKFEEALNALQTAISITPTYAEAYFNLGNVQKSLGDKKKAIESFTEYISLCNEAVIPDVYALIGDCWFALEDCDLAERFAELCLEKDPENITAKYLLGDTLMNKGMYSEAAKHFKKMLKADPHDAFLLYIIALCFLKKRNYPSAKDYARKSIEEDNELVGGWIVFFRSESDMRIPVADRDSEVLVPISLAEYTLDIINRERESMGHLHALDFLEGFARFFVGIGKHNDREKAKGLKLLAKVADEASNIFQLGISEPTLLVISLRDEIKEIMNRFNIKL